MRAVVARPAADGGAPPGLVIEDRPAPTPGAGEVVVEVAAALLAADLHPARAGLVAGVEAAGSVLAVGPGVDGWSVGDGVALPGLLTCGTCPACLAGRGNLCPHRRRPGVDVDGWLAEQVVVPARLLASVPPTVPPPLAAAVPGVVSRAYHALRRAGIGAGVTVAVVGADALGLHVTQLAALAGGEVTTFDDREAARDRALDLGAEDALALTGTSLAEALPGGVDRVVLTPAAAVPLADAVAALGAGGRVVLAEADAGTASVPTAPLVDAELDVVGSTGATLQDAVELFDLAAEGRLVLTTTLAAQHRLDELAEVERRLADGADGLRVAVDPS